MLIFDYSRRGRRAYAQSPARRDDVAFAPELMRGDDLLLPEVSELDVVRHYTRLSQLNFSIDTHFYPLGSCTMKYNPRVCNALAMLPGFLMRHPLAPAATGQMFLGCMFELPAHARAQPGQSCLEHAALATLRTFSHRPHGHRSAEALVDDGIDVLRSPPLRQGESEWFTDALRSSRS